ncbi:hypothetical protein EDC01DRAFT_632860 [Geopyxis carbonaria]|nr:hypothetical protein EDC01DRAFT_632860 [Geopyxis carbonaria]
MNCNFLCDPMGCCPCPWSRCCSKEPNPPPQNPRGKHAPAPREKRKTGSGFCWWPWSQCCSSAPRPATPPPPISIAAVTDALLELSLRLTQLRRRTGPDPHAEIPRIAYEFREIRADVREVLRVHGPSQRAGDEVGTLLGLVHDFEERLGNARTEFEVIVNVVKGY